MREATAWINMESVEFYIYMWSEMPRLWILTVLRNLCIQKFTSSQTEYDSHTTALRQWYKEDLHFTPKACQLHTTVPKHTSNRSVYPLHNLVPRYDVHARSNSLPQHWRQRGLLCTPGQRSQDCASPTCLKGDTHQAVLIDPKTVDLEHCWGI